MASTMVLDIQNDKNVPSNEYLQGMTMQDKPRADQQVSELNKLHWSMEKLFDDAETRSLFEQFLLDEVTTSTTRNLPNVSISPRANSSSISTTYGGYALLKFVSAVDQFRELKSHVNRFVRAKTIIHQFIGDISVVENAGESSLIDDQLKECCEYELNISLDTRKQFLQQFVAKYHTERCPKSLFDSIADAKFLELQLDSFKRFVRSEKFVNFMTKKKARMEWKDFVDSYVQKNIEGTIYMNQFGFKNCYSQQTGGPEVSGESPNVQKERDEPRFVNRGIQWIQSELPEGIFVDQMDPMLQKLMHPKMGIPFVFSSPAKTKFWNKLKTSVVQLKRKMKNRRNRSGIHDGVEATSVAAEAVAAEQRAKREFSGETLIDHMCDYLKFNRQDQDSRKKMVQLATLMVNKNVIGAVATQASTAHLFSEKDLYTFLLKKKLVIVGGGGMGAFLVFKALHATNQFDITVIDKRANWEYMISFHHLISVPEKLSEIQTSIAEEISSINQGVSSSKFIKGMAKHISEYAVHVQLIDESDKIEDENTVVPFDYLLVGTGSSYRNPFPIVRNETEPMNNATIIYPYLSSSIVKNIDAIRSARNIVVIGGGPVAVEFVGELCYHANETQKVHLISQCDVLLERLSEEAHWSTFATLASFKNIQFLFNRRVTQIVGNTIEYCFNEDISQDYLCKGELEADVVFCCVGFQPNTNCFERFMGDSLTDKGYVKINPDTFQVQRTGAKPTPYSWNDKLAVDVDPMGFSLKSMNRNVVIQEDMLRKEQEELKQLSNSQWQDISSVEESNMMGSKSHVSDEDFSDEAQVAEVMPTLMDIFTPSQNPEDFYAQFGPVSETEYYDHIFAIGDITYTVEEKLAHVARCHAAAFINIIQNVENREVLTLYKATGYRLQVISLGPKGGVAIKGKKVQAKGPAVTKLKSFVELSVVRDYKPSFSGHQKRK